jgi:hypothetical protein
VKLQVTVTSKRVETNFYPDWNAACGAAVREALAGAEEVVVVDGAGALFRVYAEPVGDNS